MIKKINIPSSLKLKFCLITDKKYFVVVNDSGIQYFLIPAYILCNKKSNVLCLALSSTGVNVDLLKNYSLALSKWLKSFEKPYVKKLLLKGLGLKATVSLDTNMLELKLGLSHIPSIRIPSSLMAVSVNKNIITATGSNALELGNFIAKIRSLKTPNIYKGKGIWYKNEVQVLKIIKKT